MNVFTIGAGAFQTTAGRAAPCYDDMMSPMTKMILLALLVLTLLASDAALAQQQRQTFKDANGRTLGRSVTDSRGQHHVLRLLGHNTGRSTTNGNATTTYNSFGRRTGSAINSHLTHGCVSAPLFSRWP